MSENLTCPATASTQCGEKFKGACLNKGLCCLLTPTQFLCVCLPRYDGKYCERRRRPDIAKSEDALHRTEAIAAFSAILGVVVILLFVALIFLQVKYYRNRKRRRALGEHEMDRVSKPEDSGFKWPLRNEPGYSWRESARHSHHSSKAYQTLKGPLSRSVPEDLFKMGVKIALFGMKGDDEEKNEKRNPDALGRCFSADASSGGGGGGGGEGREDIATYRYTKLQETEGNGNKEKAVSDQKTEDTVR